MIAVGLVGLCGRFVVGFDLGGIIVCFPYGFVIRRIYGSWCTWAVCVGLRLLILWMIVL